MASVAPAAATPAEPPQSGDARATAYPGNAVTCEDAGLAGGFVEVEFQIDESNRFLDILSVPSDVELTGIVVKGSSAYNVYAPQENLDGLHAPLNPGGIPEISHWYACGQEVSTTTTEENSTGSPLKDGETASEEPTTTPNDTDVAPASTTNTVAAADTSPAAGGTSGGSNNLASTGFSGSGLLLAGAGLLIVGLGLVSGVWATRRRRDNTST
jgi:hypothetical protein